MTDKPMNLIKMSIIIASLPLLSACWIMEDGEKVGEIVDLKQSGFLVKTWECKIIRGGLQDGSGIMGTSIQLTIEDKSLLEKAKRFMIEKKFISIKYHKELANFLRSDSQGFFMDAIEEINND